MPAGARLIALSASIRGQRIELTEDSYTIGRSESRDICIKDATVSSYHCELVKTGATYAVRDNSSTNGTRVNSVPLKGGSPPVELRTTDVLQVGAIEFLFDKDDRSDSTVRKEDTGIKLGNATEIDYTTTITRLENVSPFAKNSGGLKFGGKKLILWIVAALTLIIIILIAALFLAVMRQTLE
jgi:pSer/pThr/pTyr-binding forkhead associated (FHA) protein